jgi:flavin-dependent thymidylate synthase
VTCDTASHIHIIKHRIGVSVNGESARYRELKDDKYLIPDDWPSGLKANTEGFFDYAYNQYHRTIKYLVDEGFDRKRAKESARFLLPYANQLTLDVAFNFRSFMHFQGLRNKPDAQKEIREIAESMLQLVRETGRFKYSLEAFGYGEKIDTGTD